MVAYTRVGGSLGLMLGSTDLESATLCRELHQKELVQSQNGDRLHGGVVSCIFCKISIWSELEVKTLLDAVEIAVILS